jgi:hypothetical protein
MMDGVGGRVATTRDIVDHQQRIEAEELNTLCAFDTESWQEAISPFLLY